MFKVMGDSEKIHQEGPGSGVLRPFLSPAGRGPAATQPSGVPGGCWRQWQEWNRG